jgi:hypothetical protein
MSLSEFLLRIPSRYLKTHLIANRDVLSSNAKGQLMWRGSRICTRIEAVVVE